MEVATGTQDFNQVSAGMFQFLFKYPSPVFTKGRFVLLSTWPAWLLPVLILAAAGGLALLVRWRLRDAAPTLRSWRAWAVWGTQSAFVALLLLLLWQFSGPLVAFGAAAAVCAIGVVVLAPLALRSRPEIPVDRRSTWFSMHPPKAGTVHDGTGI